VALRSMAHSGLEWMFVVSYLSSSPSVSDPNVTIFLLFLLSSCIGIRQGKAGAFHCIFLCRLILHISTICWTRYLDWNAPVFFLRITNGVSGDDYIR
jgi:hypothetical protein